MNIIYLFTNVSFALMYPTLQVIELIFIVTYSFIFVRTFVHHVKVRLL